MSISLSIQLPLQMVVVEVGSLTITQNKSGYRLLEDKANAYHAQYTQNGITSPGSVEGVQVARKLFRELGIDPTKHRPSSEKLLNRVLKEKSLPAINTLVDVGNWFSLDALLPIGIYDRNALNGEIVLREGAADETYIAIGDRKINLSGRYTLADETGPFGTPITDSLRTAVTVDTSEAVLFVYAPLEACHEDLMRIVNPLIHEIDNNCGGQLEQLQIVRPCDI